MYKAACIQLFNINQSSIYLFNTNILKYTNKTIDERINSVDLTALHFISSVKGFSIVEHELAHLNNII